MLWHSMLIPGRGKNKYKLEVSLACLRKSKAASTEWRREKGEKGKSSRTEVGEIVDVPDRGQIRQSTAVTDQVKVLLIHCFISQQ